MARIFFHHQGTDLVWLCILAAMNLRTSFLTPPFGWSLFYLRGVAPPQITTGDIYRGVMPFIAIQTLGLLLVMFFSGLATWLPRTIGW
jgi:TRAP-type mannitol/chloroaromatic compound transport system permease large subunit